ncbi:MAG: exodeoxyribonuclease VII small subunit [Limnochordia bacterium]|jgi:exodeoxyribonuclease VII small subunit|nr:exodeoxyribonuclease VII small subunit [Limnochordia bacterium]
MELNEMSFEDAYTKLEGIVELLETGEMTLERSLALFEEGVALVRHCRCLLDTAEKRVEMILKEDEQITIKDFSVEDKGAASL